MLNRLDCQMRWRWFPAALFFMIVVAYIVCARIFADYGVSWDEPFMRLSGQINLNYICYRLDISSCYDPQLPLLQAHFDRAYGVAFEIPLILIEKYLKLVDSRDIYTVRHLCIFIYSLIGLVAFYWIIYYRFQSHLFSSLGVLLLGFSPRIFAESFYNNKDIVFMYANLISLLSAICLTKCPTIVRAVISGFATAFSIDIRIMGVMLIIATVILLFMTYYNKKMTFKQLSLVLLVYLMFTTVFMYILFPFLWENPWTNFLFVLERATKFPWLGQNLYYGVRVLGSQLPWHYAPVWILITTPLVIIAFFIIGVSIILTEIVKLRLKYFNNMECILDFLVFGMAIAPVLAVIVLHSTMYDGWRQLYFIYPFMILTSVKGIEYIMCRMIIKQKLKHIVAGLIIFQFVNTGYWMYLAHPLENVYFNPLARKSWKENFEMDYWGQGNTFVIKNILALDKRPSFSILAISSTLLSRALLMLDPDERKRITILLRPEDRNNEIIKEKNINERDAGNKMEADYLLNNYRGVTKDDLIQYENYYDLFYSKIISDERIIDIYKNNVAP